MNIGCNLKYFIKACCVIFSKSSNVMERFLRGNREKGEASRDAPQTERAKTDDNDGPPCDMRRKSNPFLATPVLRSLMKAVGCFRELKMLRGICGIWNEVGVEEIKKRAFHGSLKPINLSWRWKDEDEYEFDYPVPFPGKVSMSNPEMEVKLAQFLEDTQKNPKLFQGFQFNYPQFLQVINQEKFNVFLSAYNPSFIVIKINYDAPEEEEVKLFDNYLGMASNLKGLEFFHGFSSHLLENSHHFGYDQKDPAPGRFPKLQKLILNGDAPMRLFKAILDGQNLQFAPKLTTLAVEGNGCKDWDLEFDDLEDDMDYLLGLDLSLANWIQLAHLDIGGRNADPRSMLKRINWVLALSQAGMVLKSFSMELGCYYYEEDDEEDWVHFLPTFEQICKNLTAFFKIQAKSLENLVILLNLMQHRRFESEVDVNSLNISLPVFTSLRRLEIRNICQVHINGDEVNQPISFRSYARNFPQLEDLTIYGCWNDIKNWGRIRKNKGPLTLKRLKVTKVDWDMHLYSKELNIEDHMVHFLKDVRSVETLEVGNCRCSEDFFIRDGEELPWIESLKVLHIYKIEKTLKLGHLKNLRTIILEQNGFELVDTGSNVPDPDYIDQDYKRYLDKFIHIAKLDLDLIKFRGYKVSEEIQAEIIKYFPFPVEFVENKIPYSWSQCGGCGYE